MGPELVVGEARVLVRRRMVAVASAGLAGAALAASCGGGGGGSDEAGGGPQVVHASVARVDPESGRVKAVVRVGRDPLLLATAGGRVWTLDFGDGSLSRIDPRTNTATRVDVGEAVGMASDGRDVWVAANGNTLVRLDGATGDRRQVITLGREPLYRLRDAGFLTVAAGSIWLTIPVLGRNDRPQQLWRVDPADGRVEARAPLGLNPVSLAGDDLAVWVANIDSSTVTRVDVASNEATDAESGAGPAGIALGAGSVWVAHFEPTVWRLDPSTGRARARIALEETTRGIAFAAGRVWVSTPSGLVEVDPASDEVRRTFELIEPEREVGPTSIGFLDGDLWVSVE